MNDLNFRYSAKGLLFGFAMLLSVSGYSQEFIAYEGKDSIREGTGGTKKVVNGIEFWADGAPPKTFKLIGYITDRRHKTGLVGMFRMSGLENDIADVAMKNGGEAVILVSSEAETVGAVSNSIGSAQVTTSPQGQNSTARATAWNTNIAAPVQKQQSKYAVIKFVEVEATTKSENPPAAQESK